MISGLVKYYRHINKILIDSWGAGPIDIAVLFVILLSYTLLFFHPVTVHPGFFGFVIADGHILDFYDVTTARKLETIYMPPKYLVFGAFTWLLKTLGLIESASGPDLAWPTVAWMKEVFLFYKFLIFLFVAATVPAVLRIGRHLGLPVPAARLLGLAWLAHPMTAYLGFGYGAHDQLVLPFIVWGFERLFARRLFMAAFLFGLGAGFKTQALLIFIPALLYQRPGLSRLLVSLAITMGTLSSWSVLYGDSPGFVAQVVNNDHYRFILNIMLTNTVRKTGLILSIFFYVVVCCAAYFVPDDDGRKRESKTLFFGFAGLAVPFIFSWWHPHWLLILTPMMAVLSFCSRRPGDMFLLDAALMLSVFLVMAYTWPTEATGMLWLGVLELPEPVRSLAAVFDSFFPAIYRGHQQSIAWTMSSALLAANVLAKGPWWSGRDDSEKTGENVKRDAWSLRAAVLLPPIVWFGATAQLY